MPRLIKASAAGALALATLVACSDPGPAFSPPKVVRALTASDLSGTVGAKLNGGLSVKVIDYSDRGLGGVRVGFSVIAGDGTLGSLLVVTDAEGIAHTDWTLGQTAGENKVVASVFGMDVDSSATVVATGVAAAPAGLSVTPRVLRIPSTSIAGVITGRVVDQFGNVVTGAVTYTSRDEGVVTVSSSGAVNIANNNRGVSTWIVVSGSGFTDSAKVFNLSSTDTPCTGISAKATLAVGDVALTGFADNGICVPASAGDREYALVPFFNSPVPSAVSVFTVSGVGVKATQSQTLGVVRARDMLAQLTRDAAALDRGATLDRQLRLSGRRELAVRAAGARQWYASRSLVNGRSASRATTLPKVGDLVQRNVEANSFCADPKMRTGRVIGVTQRSVIMTDVANPAGYTDDELMAFGTAFDTLVYPSDVANFGAPTDVDENGGRLEIFFTHAVNEVGIGVLGFEYARDLLPKSGPIGSCPGSNVAEILYIRVPDGGVTVASAKVDVLATLAHEFQHVINDGRRLYVNTNGAPAEERWLNEGLSHIAEELLFYKSTGLTPRRNLGPQFSQNSSAYTQFMLRNFSRYFLFTSVPELQGPVGVDDEDDDLESRGAAWSFLRFAADHRAAGNETALWQSLVNGNSSGMQNLYDHLGPDIRLLMRDWGISVFMDDLVTTDPKYAQLSFNMRQVPGFRSPSVFNLTTSTSPTSTSSTVTLGALSSLFVRFGVGANQEAYVSANGYPANTTPLPHGVLLALVRTK
jgi:hypothetical protein